MPLTEMWARVEGCGDHRHHAQVFASPGVVGIGSTVR